MSLKANKTIFNGGSNIAAQQAHLQMRRTQAKQAQLLKLEKIKKAREQKNA